MTEPITAERLAEIKANLEKWMGNHWIGASVAECLTDLLAEVERLQGENASMHEAISVLHVTIELASLNFHALQGENRSMRAWLAVGHCDCDAGSDHDIPSDPAKHRKSCRYWKGWQNWVLGEPTSD